MYEEHSSVTESTAQKQQIAEFYSQIHTILFECVTDYSENIVQLFDFESLLAFLGQIDQVAKEKGTQVIQHFLNVHQVENLLASVQGRTDLDEIIIDQVNFVCEEISNFSYIHQNYCMFVSNLVSKQSDNIQTLQKVHNQLFTFSDVDELLSKYLEFEKLYIKNEFARGIERDKFEKILARPTRTGFNLNMDSMGDEVQLVDSICLLLEKTSRRALSTLNMVSCCALLNFISDDILCTDICNHFQSIFDRFTAKSHLYGLSDQPASKPENGFLIELFNYCN